MTEHLRMTAFLCLSVNFEKFFRTPLLKSTSTKLLTSCTSCKIATSGYSKKLFHSCFSSILFKNEKYSFEVYLYLKSLKLSVKKLIRHEVACYQPASLRKKLFHTFSSMYFAFIFSERITITPSEEAMKVCEHNFFQEI